MTTQVKTWAYEEGTRCLRPRIVRNWAGLKTSPQKPMQMADIPFPLCHQIPRRIRREWLLSAILSKKTDRFSRKIQRFALACVLLARGLHYNWHRFYDPEVGRYISVDPLGLDAGLNVFGYAFGNPTTYVDPDGQIPTALKLLVTAIAGLAVYIFSSKGCGTNKDGKNMADKAKDKAKESKNLVNEKYEKLIKSTCLGRNDTDEAKINCLASNGMCNLLKYKYKQLQAKERNSQLYSDERLEGLLVSCGRAKKKFKPISPWERLKRW